MSIIDLFTRRPLHMGEVIPLHRPDKKPDTKEINSDDEYIKKQKRLEEDRRRLNDIVRRNYGLGKPRK